MIGIGPYLQVLRENRQLPLCGCVTSLSSSFGQTFFIGVFSPTIQTEFGLSHTAWATIYLLGTLASAAMLPWSGKKIDRVSLALYAACVWGLLALACLTFSLATAPLGLVLGIFLLRQSGQGLMSHLALTTMARFFDRARGRAIAISTLGVAVGEARLPLIAVVALATVGWRWSYRGAAVLVILLAIPAFYLLARGRAKLPIEPRAVAGATNENGSPSAKTAAGWTRAEVLRDRRFYLLLPGLLCPSVVITAMFFHHLNLADLNGWSHEWVTGSYVLYAGAATLTSLAAGQLVDRFGAIKVVPITLIPQGIGLIFIALFDSSMALLPYLALIGITTGISHTVVAALWAELYGVAHIGSIRSLAAAVSVFGSALGPVSMGTLMDVGLSVEAVCLTFAGYCLAGTVLIWLALFRTRPRTALSA